MLALVVVGSIGYSLAYREAEQLYDTQLSHVTSLMLSLLLAEDKEEAKHGVKDDDDEKPNPDIIELGNDFEEGQGRQEKVAFRIWKNNTLLFYSSRAAIFGSKRNISGFSNEDINGKGWRFYVLSDKESGYTLEVAHKLKNRTVLINNVLISIFSPLVFLMPSIFLLTLVGLRTGLKPLLSISGAVRNRSASDLTPLSVNHSMVEINPLINSINHLLENLAYALDKERRFTDFAAHELRTPIAILKTQAQTALKSTDDLERKSILEAQVEATNRATNLVDQLLALARLEQLPLAMESISLNDIASYLVKDRQVLAEKAGLTLSLKQGAPLVIQGTPELIAISLSNLIDNAIKYTSSPGEIVVTLSRHDNVAQVSVCDNGPGIPEANLPYVTEQFYRVPGRLQSGSGLGLSIVKRATDILGAELMMHNRTTGHGLDVTISFPHVTT